MRVFLAIYPEWDSTKIGVGAQTVKKAIALSAGKNDAEVTSEWKEIGDLGDVAQKLLSKKSQGTLFSKRLTVSKVVTNIRKLSELKGAGTVSKKISLISELLSSASPVAAKYIVRTCIEDLRTGAGFGTLRDAISKAFDVPKNVIQVAYDQSTDIGKVARTAYEKGEKGLQRFGITVGHPLKVMLYQKASDIEDAFKRVGRPAAIEYKYDGFRLQVHKGGGNIKLFTRRLDEVTNQFPDVVKMVEHDVKADNIIPPRTMRYFSPQRPFISSSYLRRQHCPHARRFIGILRLETAKVMLTQ